MTSSTDKRVAMDIHFRLHNFDALHFISTTGENLSWYRLTEGSYWMEVESVPLLRYGDAAVNYWRQQGNTNPTLPAVEYWVAQLLDDFIEVTPYAFTMLPSAFLTRLADFSAWNSWVNKASQIFLSRPDDLDYATIFQTAVGWWYRRSFPMSYLSPRQEIYVWNNGQHLQVGWDNRTRVVEDTNIQAWAAVVGQAHISQAEWLNAIKVFHAQLITQMAERIAQAPHRWPRATAANLQNLQADQLAHAGTFERLLARIAVQPSVTWDEEIAALNQLEAIVPRA